MTPRAVFPQCGSPERPSARTRYRFCMDSEAGRGRRKLAAVDQLDARAGISGEEEIAIEVDVVADARDLARGPDPEARLDHAAEHDAEIERPRCMRHPNSLAEAAGLGELDVDAVRALGAGCDVAER